MQNLEIPGFGTLRLEHLVLDYNGTLARDGMILPGVADRLGRLGRDLQIHILTADTFGKAGVELADVPFVRLTILDTQEQAEAKRGYVQELGSRITACIGNGRNDRLMLQEAALGIAVVESEGAAGDALRAAHIAARDIVDALDLLIHPLRLVATLRG
jgi:soluble P-type ATPase